MTSRGGTMNYLNQTKQAEAYKNQMGNGVARSFDFKQWPNYGSAGEMYYLESGSQQWRQEQIPNASLGTRPQVGAPVNRGHGIVNHRINNFNHQPTNESNRFKILEDSTRLYGTLGYKQLYARKTMTPYLNGQYWFKQGTT